VRARWGRPRSSGTLPQALVTGELRAQRKAQAYAQWALRKQNGAEGRLVCTHDRLPENGVVTPSGFVPALALDEDEVATPSSPVSDP
jgi:hypothetical protein